MSEIDWSKAPEGATHCNFSGAWFKHDVSGVYCFIVGSWEKLPWASWQLDGFSRRPNQEWNGTGLPPVGMVCEVRLPNKTEWKQVTIKLYDEGLCVFRDEFSLSVEMFHHMAFRPIRTPEQIAAEDRHNAIMDMVRIDGAITSCMAASLYDAGYRKVDNP